MKSIKKMALLLAASLAISIAPQANAEVGYIDYQKVMEAYPAAKQAVKEIDAKTLEIQQFLVDKERQYKALDTPLKKQNFENQTASELKTKQEALYKLQNDRQTQIQSQIKEAARSVMVTQKLDAILSDEVVLVGGVDITNLVIQKLSGQ